LYFLPLLNIFIYYNITTNKSKLNKTKQCSANNKLEYQVISGLEIHSNLTNYLLTIALIFELLEILFY